MNRLKKGKIITVLIAAVMVLSVIAVLSAVSQPVYAASGSITMDPTVFSSGTAVVALVNGGTFGSGATVTFYISSTNTFTSKTSIGTYSLPAGATTLSNAVVKLTIPSESPGQYYVAASDDGGATFTAAVTVTVSSLAPKITVTSSVPSGSTATVTGSGFDVGSTINVYLGYPSGPLLIGNINAYSGSFSGSFTVPTSLSQTDNPFYVIAQESSSSSANYGITADGTFTLLASISVSPVDISPSASSTVTINGYGFYASSTISSNSISLSPASGSITAESNVAVTVSSTGSFSVSVTFDSVGASGPVSITITTSPASSPSSFPSSFYISQPNPASMKFSFSVTPTYSTTINSGDAVTATVYNFPASQSVKIMLGGMTVGTMTTDSNGYASLSTTIPAMPAGSYSPTALVPSLGLYSQLSAIAVSSYFDVKDPSGTMLTSTLSEYVPSTGILTVQAYGLTPSTLYDPEDSLAAPSGIFTAGLVTSVSVGTASAQGIYPAYNGTIIFSYRADYPSGTATSTSSSITIAGINGYGGNNFGYKAVGSAVVSTPSPFGILTPGSPATLTVTSLIPYGSAVYPGLSYYYNAYLGPDELTLTYSSTSSAVFYGTGGTFSGSFIVPSLTGINNVSITPNGQPLSSAVGAQYTIESVAGTSPSSGSIAVIPITGGYEVAGFDYYIAPTVYYMTYAGRSSGTTVTLTSGAFAISIAPGPQPSGTYSVFTEVSSSGVNYFVYSSYTSVPTLKVASPSKSGTGQYEGPVGTPISISLTGLNPYAYYNVTFGPVLEGYPVESDGSGSISSISFNAPALPKGIYQIGVTEVGQSSPVVTVPFNLTENPDISLSTGSQYAFPGEIVQFSVSGLGSPTLPLGSATGKPAYFMMVDLNSTPYQYVPAEYSSSGTMTGSFIMPNNASGTYYEITFTGYESTISAFTSSSTSGYVNVTAAFPNSQSDFIELVSGNGALVTGISQSQIASIDASINATLSVPISQLEASVSSIDGNVAHLTTAFGNMTASLNAIDATVSSIESGIAIVNTTLGTVKTSLSSINATIVSMNGSLVKVSTTAGKLTTTLSSINLEVTNISAGIATIQTDLGTFTGSVKSVSDGIATIETSLGTIKVNVGNLKSSVTQIQNYGLILDVVLIALVAVTLGIAVGTLLSTRDMRKRFGMKKE